MGSVQVKVAVQAKWKTGPIENLDIKVSKRPDDQAVPQAKPHQQQHQRQSQQQTQNQVRPSPREEHDVRQQPSQGKPLPNHEEELLRIRTQPIPPLKVGRGLWLNFKRPHEGPSQDGSSKRPRTDPLQAKEAAQAAASPATSTATRDNYAQSPDELVAGLAKCLGYGGVESFQRSHPETVQYCWSGGLEELKAKRPFTYRKYMYYLKQQNPSEDFQYSDGSPVVLGDGPLNHHEKRKGE